MDKINCNNVIDFNSMRFPVGTQAWHPVYRLCTIVESADNLRRIKAPKLGILNIIWEDEIIHVNELIRLVHPTEAELSS